MSNKRYRAAIGIQKIIEVFQCVKERLPSTYPQASLVIHMNEDELRDYYYIKYGGEEEEWEEGDRNWPSYPPCAFCDGDTYAVHLHADMGRKSSKDISFIILHEIGHLYALQRYGEKDKRWSIPSVTEPYADRFAYRWVRRLLVEGLFNNS